jgi:hypothetical protein
LAISGFKVAAVIGIIVTVAALLLSCPSTQAQVGTAFEPTTAFSVPAYNGTVNFAVNGTYSNAAFQNNVWTFTNLRLKGSQLLANFSISARNCNVTVFSYQMLDPINRISFLQYGVTGEGTQILNFGFGRESSGALINAEWSVVLHNHVFANEGQGWTIAHDGTLSVSGANGNVTIIHTGSVSGFGQNSNLPFYEQHSVAIVVVVAVVAIVGVGVVVNVNIKRRKDDVV